MTGFAGPIDWQLDRDSGIPVYAQIERRLSELIESGVLAVGERVPSERELAELAGVSRLTARAALDSLARKGCSSGDRATRKRCQPLEADLDLTDSAASPRWSDAMASPPPRACRSCPDPAPRAVAAELGSPWRPGLPRPPPAARRGHADRARGLVDPGRAVSRIPGHDVRGSAVRADARRLRDRARPRHPARSSRCWLTAARRMRFRPAREPADAREPRRALPRAGIPVEFARDHHRGDRARFTVEVSTPAWRGNRADDSTAESRV